MYTTFADSSSAEKEFERAWNNPKYTQIRLNDIDINKVLSHYYETSSPVKFTRKMLWDMESKKAWDPKSYIPYVVREGKSWGKEHLKNGDELFVRSSHQRQWLNPNEFAEVFEEVYLNHKDQKVTFLGAKRLKDSSGKILNIKERQPIFHVQHAVEGPEDHPKNIWRIVHLTEAQDQNILDAFEKLNIPTRLPGYIEKYIEKDLNISLSHKQT